jgi:hypothetical protein
MLPVLARELVEDIIRFPVTVERAADLGVAPAHGRRLQVLDQESGSVCSEALVEREGAPPDRRRDGRRAARPRRSTQPARPGRCSCVGIGASLRRKDHVLLRSLRPTKRIRAHTAAMSGGP